MSEFTFALDLPPGLDSNTTNFAAAGHWADGNEVRFVDGRPQGTGAIAGFLNGMFNSVRKLHAYQVGTTVRVAIASDSFLYSVIVGGPMWNITPALWNGMGGRGAGFAMWGDVLLASNSGGKLFQSVNGGVATHVTQAPSQITAMLVTPERQVLALGCNEEVSGTFNSRCIRGCDLEDLTDWTSTATNNAFEHILEGVGAIVTARVIGPYVAVWTTTSLYLGQFVGDPAQTYRFDLVAENCGCVGLDSVTVANQTAYWIGHDLQPRMWTPGAAPQVIPCPISRAFLDNCSFANKTKIHACLVSRYGEVFFYYPDQRDSTTECSRYIAYSIRESAAFQRPVWFRGQRARAAALDSPLLASDLSAKGTTVIGMPANGWLEADECTFGGWPAWFIQSADQYIDNAQRRVMIRRFVPDFLDGPYFDLTLFLRDWPRSAARVKGPYTVEYDDRKIDLRASGMMVAVKLSGFPRVKFGRSILEGTVLGSR